METIKYLFLLLFIFIIFGWYCKSEDTENIVKERLLSNSEKLKYIENPHNNWYYRKSTYKIVKKRSIIPFLHNKIDSLKQPIIKYYQTSEPLNHNGNPNDDTNCGC